MFRVLKGQGIVESADGDDRYVLRALSTCSEFVWWVGVKEAEHGDIQGHRISAYPCETGGYLSPSAMEGRGLVVGGRVFPAFGVDGDRTLLTTTMWARRQARCDVGLLGTRSSHIWNQGCYICEDGNPLAPGS